MRQGVPRKRRVTASTRGANRRTPALPVPRPVLDADEIAIVEAIRRAYGSPTGYGGLEAFHCG
jgi:hypothetical protein